MSWLRRWSLALVALAGVAAGCSAARKTPEPIVVTIAVQSPLSGPQAVLGKGVMNAAELAVDAMRTALESFGVRLELVAFDDEASPPVGVANARAIVADARIMAVIGHLNSGVAIPASEVYREANLAMISPANTNPLVTDRGLPNVSRVIGRDDMQGGAAAVFSHQALSARTADVVHDGTAYGADTARSFTTHARRLGLSVGAGHAVRTAADVKRTLDDLEQRRSDVVFFGGIHEQAGPFLRQLRERGVSAAFIGPDGLDSEDFTALAGEAAVGVYYVMVVAPASQYAGAQAFRDAYVGRFHRQPEYFAASAYDATTVAIHAIAAVARTGTPLSRASVAAAVRAVTFQGITGPIAFDSAGDLSAALYFVLRVASSDSRRWGDNGETFRIALPHR